MFHRCSCEHSGTLLYMSTWMKHIKADLKNLFIKFQGGYQNSNIDFFFYFDIGESGDEGRGRLKVSGFSSFF